MVECGLFKKCANNTLPIHRLLHEVQPLQLDHSIPIQVKRAHKEPNSFRSNKDVLMPCFGNQREFINERLNHVFVLSDGSKPVEPGCYKIIAY